MHSPQPALPNQTGTSEHNGRLCEGKWILGRQQQSHANCTGMQRLSPSHKAIPLELQGQCGFTLSSPTEGPWVEWKQQAFSWRFLRVSRTLQVLVSYPSGLSMTLHKDQLK